MRAVFLTLALSLMASAVAGASETAGSRTDTIGGALLRPISYDDLAGWPDDDHGLAFLAFRRSCEKLLSGESATRPGIAADSRLRAVCAAANGLALPDRVEARRFFESRFEPVEVTPPSGRGFLTGYFEPEFAGSLEPDATFAAPLLARPDDLVTLEDPGAGLAAMRRREDGRLEPYPDRAAIETGALGARGRPVVFLRDPVDAFIVHVQGSARIRLPGGDVVRVAYAGRNGWPYTSIGRLLAEREGIPPADLNLAGLTRWLRAHPERGRDLMRENRSFIFFRRADELAPADGPIGAMGVPLMAGRSLAVDRTLWPYGTPVWLEGEIPDVRGQPTPLRRLLAAHDTGTAIVGPARGDLFVGSGPEAGTIAGAIRHPIRFVVLRPRPDAAARP
jgi:membrane-bound lytic murein transglycosylase A